MITNEMKLWNIAPYKMLLFDPHYFIGYYHKTESQCVFHGHHIVTFCLDAHVLIRVAYFKIYYNINFQDSV